MAAAMLAAGCVSYRPRSPAEASALDGAQAQRRGDLIVTVAVPDAATTRKRFGVDLWRRRIQPVWLRVQNDGPDTWTLLKAGIDPAYYPAAEAARATHFSTATRVASYGVASVVFLPLALPGAIDVWRAHAANARMDEDFAAQALNGTLVPPGGAIEGFVFTPLDPGTKHVPVPLLGPDGVVRLDFYVPVAGIRSDHRETDLATRVAEAASIALPDEAALRAALRPLPCCVTGRDGRRTGDPLNLVLIAHFDDLLHALRSARWDETEVLYGGSMWKTVRSFVAGSEYRVSPVSDLYLDGRQQDVAFQKTRYSIRQRHHFRLWATPWRFGDRPVWVGAATRDIGVRLTSRTWNLTTHAIDPDVDDARDYVVGDLIESGRAAAVGVVDGVGRATPDRPRRTLTGDPWFTDGYRAVVVVPPEPVEAPRIFDWGVPGAG